MDDNLRKQLQLVLNRQLEKATETRFRITNYDEKTIAEMLMMFYQQEVIKRRVQFINDSITQQKIEKAAKWLTGNYKVGLLLYGTVGSGKSTLARAVCNMIGVLYQSAFASDRKGVSRVSALDLAKNVGDDPAYFNKLKNVDMLFVDDIGTEPSSVKSWGNEFSPVTELIYARYDRQLFTLATSNLKESDFSERYGERIADRLDEMFERIHYSNKSYRK
jgi:DNA replication protein DnaC